MRRRQFSRRDFLRTTAAGAAGLALWGCTSANKQGSTPTPGKIGVAPATGGQAKPGGILNYIGLNALNWDPISSTSYTTNRNMGMVFEPLLNFKYGPQYPWDDTTPGPNIATSWEQPDPLTYIFTIRQGVKFHNKAPVNGREVTIDDVKFSLERARDTKVGTQERVHQFGPVDKIEVVGKDKIKIVTKFPYGALTRYLSTRPADITPHEIVDQIVKEGGWEIKKPELAIGTGPWMLDSYTPDVKAAYRKNPDYWQKGVPLLDGVDMPIIPDPAAHLAAFRTGKIDIRDTSSQEIDSVKDVKGLQTYEYYPPGTLYIAMRTEQKPFSDIRVRRAMALAVDWDGWIKGIHKGKGALSGPMTPTWTKWFLPYDKRGDAAQWYKYDVAQAKKLLADAGYPNGFQTVLNGTPFYGPAYTEQMELFKSYLDAVGIKAEIKLKEYGAYMASTAVGDYEGIAGPMPTHWYVDPNDYLYYFYYTGMPGNLSHINDPDLNKLLDGQRQEMDDNKRVSQIHEITKYVTDKAYVLYAPSGISYEASQSYVRNFRGKSGWCVAPMGAWFANVWLDKA